MRLTRQRWRAHLKDLSLESQVPPQRAGISSPSWGGFFFFSPCHWNKRGGGDTRTTDSMDLPHTGRVRSDASIPRHLMEEGLLGVGQQVLTETLRGERNDALAAQRLADARAFGVEAVDQQTLQKAFVDPGVDSQFMQSSYTWRRPNVSRRDAPQVILPRPTTARLYGMVDAERDHDLEEIQQSGQTIRVSKLPLPERPQVMSSDQVLNRALGVRAIPTVSKAEVAALVPQRVFHDEETAGKQMRTRRNVASFASVAGNRAHSRVASAVDLGRSQTMYDGHNLRAPHSARHVRLEDTNRHLIGGDDPFGPAFGFAEGGAMREASEQPDRVGREALLPQQAAMGGVGQQHPVEKRPERSQCHLKSSSRAQRNEAILYASPDTLVETRQSSISTSRLRVDARRLHDHTAGAHGTQLKMSAGATAPSQRAPEYHAPVPSAAHFPGDGGGVVRSQHDVPLSVHRQAAGHRGSRHIPGVAKPLDAPVSIGDTDAVAGIATCLAGDALIRRPALHGHVNLHPCRDADPLTRVGGDDVVGGSARPTHAGVMLGVADATVAPKPNATSVEVRSARPLHGKAQVQSSDSILTRRLEVDNFLQGHGTLRSAHVVLSHRDAAAIQTARSVRAPMDMVALRVHAPARVDRDRTVATDTVGGGAHVGGGAPHAMPLTAAVQLASRDATTIDCPLMDESTRAAPMLPVVSVEREGDIPNARHAMGGLDGSSGVVPGQQTHTVASRTELSSFTRVLAQSIDIGGRSRSAQQKLGEDAMQQPAPAPTPTMAAYGGTAPAPEQSMSRRRLGGHDTFRHTLRAIGSAFQREPAAEAKVSDTAASNRGGAEHNVAPTLRSLPVESSVLRVHNLHSHLGDDATKLEMPRPPLRARPASAMSHRSALDRDDWEEMS